MQQLDIKYFFPLTEQISLELDYTPCEKYEEDKRRDATYIGNRIDQWGVTSGMTLMSTANTTTWAELTNPKLIIYPDATPITIRTKDKPSILTRWVYKILGANWERA